LLWGTGFALDRLEADAQGVLVSAANPDGSAHAVLIV
jgi:hypothetical protein